tara:strand:- start:681 stop:896 length:216 start_codon:yes stop_codon:yes gene_type:complete
MNKRNLADLVYEEGLKEKIRSSYIKRIEHLIGANNELMRELERCEAEKETFAAIADSVLLNDNKEKKRKVY